MKSPRIGILTSPIEEAARTPLSNLIAVLGNESDPTYVITGNAALDFLHDDTGLHVEGVRYRAGKYPLSKIARYVLVQTRLALIMLSATRSVDIWVFFIGGESLVVPMLVTRLTGRTVLLMLSGSDERSLRFAKDNFHKVLRLLSEINRRLSHRVVVYSSRLGREWRLGLLRAENLISP